MTIRGKIKKYLKWYAFPIIYFLVTGLVCAYAWYARPIPYRVGIKVVFKTISLNPTLILTGVITVWIILAILLIPISLWLKKRFPECSILIKLANFSQKKNILQNTSSNKKPLSFWDKTVNGSILALGIILIVAALSIALWISKPYITFLFSASKTEALEEKARLFEQVRSDVMKGAMQYAEDTRKRNERLQGRLWQSAELTGRKNWIIFPNAIVDAPIIEGVSEDKLSEGVCHIPESAAPGEGGNCIIIGHNLGDFFEWSWPSGPFHMLEATEKGQLIYIFYSGKKYIYKVKEKTYRNANDPTLYDFSPRERLTLITCAASSDPTVYANTRVVITAYPQ